MNRLFNQSSLLVTVETDIGVTGIGEGGSPDLIRDLAGSVIGQNPFEIERLWQHMYMDTFYPPGREKIHGQGAIDLALWDIKGKVLQLRWLCVFVSFVVLEASSERLLLTLSVVGFRRSRVRSSSSASRHCVHRPVDSRPSRPPT